MSVRILLRDKYGEMVGRQVREADDVTSVDMDGVTYERVGVEDHEIILVAVCDTCGKAGHEADCYELQHMGRN